MSNGAVPHPVAAPARTYDSLLAVFYRGSDIL
jgi:hypothetical protein